jgi:uncharacterized protein involved in exopolysaccharide biosynthesis
LVEEDLKNADQSQVNLYFQKQMLMIDLDIFNKRRLAMVNIKNRNEAKLEERPLISLTLNRLEQEVNANRQIYDIFLSQARGSEIEQALQRSEAEYKLKIIEPANKPFQPIKPDKKIILAIALVVGLAIGGGAIFGLEFIDQTYKDVVSIEKEFNLPVLGIIPKLDFNETQRVLPKLLVKIITPAVILLVFVFLVLKFKLLSF